MSFPRYPAYKPSGVEWLGEAPEHWDVIRLKNTLYCRITDGPHTTPKFVDEGVPFLSVDAIQDSELIFDGCRRISRENHEEYRRKACPMRNDILMGKAASTGKIARVKTDFEFSIWSPLALIRVDGSCSSPTFYEQALKSKASQAQIDVLCTSNTQKNISMDDIPRLIVTRPPLREQEAIATFLDCETAKIDALIAEQQRLIELLQEKRQAVISHAVTKGLNPDAPMKDSGVEWLGEVPEHWRVMQLNKLINKITNGYVGPTRDILVDEGVRYLQSLHKKSNRIIFETPYYVSSEWSLSKEKSILRAGDVLIVQTGDIGQSAVVTNEFEGCNCHALIVVGPREVSISGDWLSWVLNSTYGRETLLSIQTGALHPHLNCGSVKYIQIPVAPKDEQSAICKHIQIKNEEFDRLISAASSSINLMQERRSALISAAVTGQIDVRGLVADEAAAA